MSTDISRYNLFSSGNTNRIMAIENSNTYHQQHQNNSDSTNTSQSYHPLRVAQQQTQATNATQQVLPPLRSILHDVSSFEDDQLQGQQQIYKGRNYQTFTHQRRDDQFQNQAIRLPTLIPSVSIQPINGQQPQQQNQDNSISQSMPVSPIGNIVASTTSSGSSKTTSPGMMISRVEHQINSSVLVPSSIAASEIGINNNGSSTTTPRILSSGVNKIRKKYECTVCLKNFTTSGHLARHTRIHTGERNHVCPFDGCGARFSRQDNCMQHYRTHLNKGSRRKNGVK